MELNKILLVLKTAKAYAILGASMQSSYYTSRAMDQMTLVRELIKQYNQNDITVFYNLKLAA